MKKIQLLILVMVAMVSCTARGENLQTQVATPQACPKVKLTTSMGDITVILYNETPKHRDNFLKLCREGFYDGTLFHRVIKDFMIQGGDPNSRNAAVDSQLGMGDPGYTIEAEILPQFYHKRGALAAARTGDEVNPERRSSGSQFYIVTGRVYNAAEVASMERRLAENAKQGYWNKLCYDHRTEIQQAQQAGDTTALNALQQRLITQLENHFAAEPFSFTTEQRQLYTSVGGAPHLDGQYTVFGEVIEGLDVVDKIQRVATGAADRPTTDVKIIKVEILQ